MKKLNGQMNDTELSDALIVKLGGANTTDNIDYEGLHQLLTKNFDAAMLKKAVPLWLGQLGLFGCCIFINYLRDYAGTDQHTAILDDSAIQTMVEAVAKHLETRMLAKEPSWKEIEVSKFLIVITQDYMGAKTKDKAMPLVKNLARLTTRAIRLRH